MILIAAWKLSLMTSKSTKNLQKVSLTEEKLEPGIGSVWEYSESK